MAESGHQTSMSACHCAQCTQNWTNESSALRENTVPINQRRAYYQMNRYTSSAALAYVGSPTHVYNEYHSGLFQTQMSSNVIPAYVTSIFRSNDGQMYNVTDSRPSPARVSAAIRSYTPLSNRMWASPDTFQGLHSQTTPGSVVLPDPNNWIYRINNLISSETRTQASASQRINNTTALNDLTVNRHTLDEISSGSTFPTQPSSMPPSNLVSSNYPPYLMSSTAPNTPQLSPNIPSAVTQESSTDFNNQHQLNNNTNVQMARVMDDTEGNSESEAEIDRNLREEVSIPEEDIIDHQMQLCPRNDTDVCDDDCPYLHGRLCTMCHTHRINPSNPGLHINACIEQLEKQSQNMECNICMEKITELETGRFFGLLENCNHCFCIGCLLAWRKNEAMANHKACPVCRTHSDFIMGSKYWLTCPQSKKKVMDWMKENNEAIEYLDY